MTDPRLSNSVLVFTKCDHITQRVREALGPRHALVFAETEDTLHRNALRGTSLVVLHTADPCTAGRLVRAVPMLPAPLIALTDTVAYARVAAQSSELLSDVLCVQTERWASLMVAWAQAPGRARQLVAELRVLHRSAPADLLPALDSLMLAPESSVSVKQWSAMAGVSRATLHRDLSSMGISPSRVVDVVRSLHSLGRYLVNGTAQVGRHREWSAVRTERRVLARTLNLTQAEIGTAGEPGSARVQTLVAGRLVDYFARVQECPIRALPAFFRCLT